MASGEEVLRQYLVSLGWKIKEDDFKKFKDRMEETTKRYKDLSATLEKFAGYAAGAATAVTTAVLRVTGNLKDLYFSAQRSSASAQNLLSFQKAAQAIGVSSDEASAAVLGMARAMRETPGMRGLFQQITGVAPTKDAVQNVFKLVDALNKMLPGEKLFYQRAAYAQQFGLDSDSLFMIEQNRAELEKYYKQFELQTKEIDKQSQASKEFENHLSVLRGKWEELERSLTGFLPTGEKVLEWLDRFTGFALKADSATDGWTTRIGALVAALGGLFAGKWAVGKGLAWLGRLLGISTAGEGAAAAGTSGAGMAGSIAGVAVGLPASIYGLYKTGSIFWKQYHMTDEEQKERHRKRLELYRRQNPGIDPETGKPYARTGAATPEELISMYSKQYGLDPQLMLSLAHQESRFNPKATSKKGAMGVMQLMPELAKQMGVDNPYDAEQNIRAGIQHFADLMKKYGGNEILSMAAYNAGSGAVAKYGGVPPYKETQNYIYDILKYKMGQELAAGQRAIHLSQDTKITVTGVEDAKQISSSVVKEQDRVNGDLLRNMQGAMR